VEIEKSPKEEKGRLTPREQPLCEVHWGATSGIGTRRLRGGEMLNADVRKRVSGGLEELGGKKWERGHA